MPVQIYTCKGVLGKETECNVQVFHPNAPSYFQTQVTSLFRRQELVKKREYGDRIRTVECGSFTPLVFSTFGGIGKEATIFYNT